MGLYLTLNNSLSMDSFEGNVLPCPSYCTGRANRQFMLAKQGLEAVHVPIGWASNLEDLAKAAAPKLLDHEKDIDVLFFGGQTCQLESTKLARSLASS